MQYEFGEYKKEQLLRIQKKEQYEFGESKKRSNLGIRKRSTFGDDRKRSTNLILNYLFLRFEKVNSMLLKLFLLCLLYTPKLSKSTKNDKK